MLHSTTYVKQNFGECIDEAQHEPIGIKKRDRIVAYLVSKRDFDEMVKKIEELEKTIV